MGVAGIELRDKADSTLHLRKKKRVGGLVGELD